MLAVYNTLRSGEMCFYVYLLWQFAKETKITSKPGNQGENKYTLMSCQVFCYFFYVTLNRHSQTWCLSRLKSHSTTPYRNLSALYSYLPTTQFSGPDKASGKVHHVGVFVCVYAQ